MVKIKNKQVFGRNMDQYKKMKCPRCSTIMRKVVMEKVRHPSKAVLDVCPKCGGMWIDNNEIKLLFNYSKKARKRK